jgi:hypothetical protein
VIKIRYSDLPAGLHASARSEGRHTVIYLVPGLSAADRQGAIDRLRASARVGHSPKVPAIPLALALIADRIRLNVRNAAAAARLHPIGAAIPVVVLGGAAILYALFVTVSIRIGGPAPQAATARLPVAAATAPAAGPSAPAEGAPTYASRLTGASAARSGPRAADGAASGQVTGAHPGPSATPTPSPAPTVSTSPPGYPSPPPSPSRPPSPSPSPSPTRSHGGVCLNLGPLGICLNV